MTMTTKPPLPVASVIKHEDKTVKLKGFISAALDRIEASPASQSASEVTLIARSPASPVFRAVAEYAGRIQRNGLAFRVVLSAFDTPADCADWRVAGEAPIGLAGLRHARNPRLADAHEQLVIGTDVCWLGDCMRRDPLKRDAFETYATFPGTHVDVARLSFERLWLACVAVATLSKRPLSRAAVPALTDPAEAASAMAAALNGESTAHVVASTLH
jgi:hypothetical protein